MTSGIANIDTPALVTETELTSSNITVRIAGSAETQARSELDAFLNRLHARVVSTKLGEVVIDMRALEFMNASCFKAFVLWIDRLQEAPATSKYRVRFIHDESKQWQSRTLGALAGFAIGLISVETS